MKKVILFGIIGFISVAGFGAVAFVVASGFFVAFDLAPASVPASALAPVLAPPPEAAQTSSSAFFEQEVFRLTNAMRERAGIQLLEWDVRLAAAARAHSADMSENDFLSHTGSDGSHLTERLDAVSFGWVAAAENVAFGQKTPEEVVAAWMESEGHRGNILNPGLTHLGVGFENNKWTQKFGTPQRH